MKFNFLNLKSEKVNCPICGKLNTNVWACRDCFKLIAGKPIQVKNKILQTGMEKLINKERLEKLEQI
jgi:ribosomal protein L37AE/L43A